MGIFPHAIDGIINEAQYHASKIRTAFLLKEVNYEDMISDWSIVR